MDVSEILNNKQVLKMGTQPSDTSLVTNTINEKIDNILAQFKTQYPGNHVENNAADSNQANSVKALMQQTMQSLLAVTAYVPQPGSGNTLNRWQTLAKVAAADLNLVKWFEAHLDAVSILNELNVANVPQGLWAIWAAEGSPNPLTYHDGILNGTKLWCSGADTVDYGLVTYHDAKNNSQLLMVDMRSPGITIDSSDWQAVGMPLTATSTVHFTQVPARSISTNQTHKSLYLARPGFWHGAAGVAACWYGATVQIAHYLLDSYSQKPHDFKAMYLGEVSTQLAVTRQYFHALASIIDQDPSQSHVLMIRQLRAQVEKTARFVLDTVGQALGATPYCKSAHFARLSADLPVFIRQSHGAFDAMAIGELVAEVSNSDKQGATLWQL